MPNYESRTKEGSKARLDTPELLQGWDRGAREGRAGCGATATLRYRSWRSLAHRPSVL